MMTLEEIAINDLVQIHDKDPEAADCIGVVVGIADGKVQIALAVPNFWGSVRIELTRPTSEIARLADSAPRVPCGS